MIGRLRGTLAEKHPPHVILDINGLGYELEVPMTTLYRLPAVGEPLTLHTHLVVREDAHLLYGFFEKRERELFRELIRLNGVGPKLALALMSGLEVDELVRCVQAQDTSVLVKIPGVGKKTAERLLIELKNRLHLNILESATNLGGSSSVGDVRDALAGLGYSAEEIRDVLREMSVTNDSELMLREALNLLGVQMKLLSTR